MSRKTKRRCPNTVCLAYREKDEDPAGQGGYLPCAKCGNTDEPLPPFENAAA